MDKIKAFKENIFLWYEFKENATGVVFSKDEDYKTILEKKINIVPMEDNSPLDYVVFVGETDIFSKIENLDNQITHQTKIIVINENQLSINHISKYPKNVEVLRENGISVISDLEQQMKNLGFANSNVYYAFPKYDFADIIFKSTFKINEEQLLKYIPALEENEIQTLDELSFLRQIFNIDSNLLSFFANSYFIEFSKQENYQDINYVSFNNTRKAEYRLMTLIRDKVVQKVSVNENSNNHLENMKKNIEILKSQNVNILDYSENGNIYSKLIKEKNTLDVVLAENANDLEYVVNYLNRIKEICMKNAIDYNEEIKQTLEKYEIDCEKVKELKFLENAFIDFVPKNCFEIDNELYFFDQEWNEKYLPVDFIIYRGIINCYDLVKKININELFEKLNLSKYIDIFEKINSKIMKDILDEELFEKVIAKNITRIDNLVYERNTQKQQIKNFEVEDTNKTKLIDNLQVETLKKDQTIDELYKKIDNLYKESSRKEDVISDYQQEEKRKGEYIVVLENIKQNQEEQINKLNEVNLQKDDMIENLRNILEAKNNQIAIYENMKYIKLMNKLKSKNKGEKKHD